MSITSEYLVTGRYVVVSPEKVIDSGAVYVQNGNVVESGTYDELKRKYPHAPELGNSDHLVLPAFVNAHGHGKGVTDFQRGHIDDTLETWKFRNYPPIPVSLDGQWNAIKLLEAGVTTTMHNHMPGNPQEYLEEFEAIAEGLR